VVAFLRNCGATVECFLPTTASSFWFVLQELQSIVKIQYMIAQ